MPTDIKNVNNSLFTIDIIRNLWYNNKDKNISEEEKMNEVKNLTICDHPLIQHKLSILRSVDTGCKEFRELVSEIAMLVAYEATRDLPLRDVEIETPLEKMTAKEIAGRNLAIIPILRAGLGMEPGILSLLPASKVGHIGLYRDHDTAKPVTYYCKFPVDISERIAIILDPMLATGGSAIAAIDMVKEAGVKNIKMMNIVAAPEGVAAVHAAHPDVQIYCAALDRELNEHSYILPGLGDAGDRIFGTK